MLDLNYFNKKYVLIGWEKFESAIIRDYICEKY